MSIVNKRLTPAQQAMLKERKGTCIDTYKPFIALRDAGLINVSGIAPYSRASWVINEDGEQVLAGIGS